MRARGPLLIYDNAIDAASLRIPTCRLRGAARVGGDFELADVARDRNAGRKSRSGPREVGADHPIARICRDKERADAEALSEALGGLPLAHEQAAAYCERLEVSLAEYRRRFSTRRPARLLDADKDARRPNITTS